MLELAAAVWDLDIPATVARFARHGLLLPTEPKKVDRYEQDHVQYRQRLRDVWQEAQRGRIFRSGQLQKLLHCLGLSWEGSEQAWNDGPGCLLGGLDSLKVEECFAPKVMKHTQERRERVNPSGRAIFRGGGWTDVLTIPFYDLPGRICAFFCIGRNADPFEDFVLKCANFAFSGNQHCKPPTEAGLSVHPEILSDIEHWDNTIVATNDIVTALRLQVRHLHNSRIPLPLAVWLNEVSDDIGPTSGRHHCTNNAWSMLQNHKVAFWMPQFDCATVRQAIKVGGLISTIGPRSPDEQALKEYSWKMPPWELIKQIQSTAKPWQQVLSRELNSMTSVDIEELLLTFEENEDDVESILRHCQGTARERVFEVQSAIDLPRRVTLNRQTILETKDGWYVISKRTGNHERIVNAVFRIDTAIRHRRLDTVYYQGRILFEGHEVELCEQKERIEKNTLKWMRNLLFKREVGVLIYNPDWSRRIVTIANLFHEMRLTIGVNTVGWNNERLCFVLPDYSIFLGGDVKPTEGALFPENNTPGKELEEPIVPSPEELDRPAQGEELAKLFWATTACVLRSILAPAFNQETRGTALIGSAISVGITVAASLGCIVKQIRTAKDVHRALDDEQVHQWPTVFSVLPSVQQRHWRMLIEGRGKPRNCIIGVDRRGEFAEGNGWEIIDGRCKARVGSEIQELAQQLIPNYLRNLCARSLQLDDGSDAESTFTERVLRDLARFVGEHHGDTAPVLLARDVMTHSHDESYCSVAT